MTAMQSRLLGVALLLSAVAFVMQVTRGGDPASDGGESTDVRARKGESEREYAQHLSRLAAGPYVAQTKRLSDTEEIQEIVIPEGYTEELDTRCIVYQNYELRTSALTCGGIRFHPSAGGP